MRKPTIALVDGFAMGSGLALSAACDLRICSPAAVFGLPIARTVGNCLSMENYARLAALLGEARVKDIVFTARRVDAAEALAIGLATEVVEDAAARVEELCELLARSRGDDHVGDQGGAAAAAAGAGRRRPRARGLRQRRVPRARRGVPQALTGGSRVSRTMGISRSVFSWYLP